MTLSIRVATRDDIGLIAQFIHALAEYEKLLHEVRFDEAVLAEKLFGARPYACLLYTSPSPRDYAASRMPSSA